MSRKVTQANVPVSLPSNGLKWPILWDESNFLTGRLLTIIEASIPGKDQCKAVKDLIHGAIQDSKDRYYKLCFETVKRGIEELDKNIHFV